MLEGWSDETYFILFDSVESTDLTIRYGVQRSLPGCVVVGLVGWGDFIVRDGSGRHFRVPTVPAVPKYLAPAAAPPDGEQLQRDARVQGKVKWYLQPLLFGGSSEDGSNVAWIDLDTHVDLVRWWNHKYEEIGAGNGA